MASGDDKLGYGLSGIGQRARSAEERFGGASGKDSRLGGVHLRDHLGFRPVPVDDLEPAGKERFCRWAESCGEVIQIGGRGAIVLMAPGRGRGETADLR